ncbi:3-oxoacyl-(Acyl-carrier-protein) reductase [Sphingomonas paucimobilis]|nr:3-oxoacyl-(Acyl-carrier-protein) reductase [Sphingomonas paucimobilis]
MSEDARTSRGKVEGRLAGKVAMLTGVAGGQGREAALLFARAGAAVFGCDINEDGLRQTRALAEAEGLTLDLDVADATNPQQMKRWADAVVQKQGGIDILYNNGGSARFAPFAETSIEMWHDNLRVELDVIFVPTQAVWPHMIKRGGGSIINIGSISGMGGAEPIEGVGALAHGTAKSGVIAMSRQLAVEGAPHWIRVNAISPGITATPATQPLLREKPRLKAFFEDSSALARLGSPADVVYTGLFLASDEAAYITGANIPVDGGATARLSLTFRG